MYGGLSDCHRNLGNRNTCVTNNNNNNHPHHKISITKDEIDRINSMNEDDLENLINQTIHERWQNTLHSVSQPHHHHHRDLSSAEQHLTDDGDESSSSSLTSNLSTDDEDDARDSAGLISETAAKALSRSFPQTMY